MITFADGQKPPVLEALKAGNIPYKKSFKFNNSALFSENSGGEGQGDHSDDDDDDDSFNYMFWKMGTTSFKKFFKELHTVKAKSLALTQEVLKERENLEVTVQGVQEQVQMGLMKLSELEQEEHILNKYKAKIETNKNFQYQVDVPHFDKVELEAGEYVTNCLTCHATCHFPCYIPRDEDKAGCAAMSNEYCTICPGKCVWNVHVNNGYRVETSSKKETRTFDKLKKRYTDASEGKSQKETVRKDLWS